MSVKSKIENLLKFVTANIGGDKLDRAKVNEIQKEYNQLLMPLIIGALPKDGKVNRFKIWKRSIPQRAAMVQVKAINDEWMREFVCFHLLGTVPEAGVCMHSKIQSVRSSDVDLSFVDKIKAADFKAKVAIAMGTYLTNEDIDALQAMAESVAKTNFRILMAILAGLAAVGVGGIIAINVFANNCDEECDGECDGEEDGECSDDDFDEVSDDDMPEASIEDEA